MSKTLHIITENLSHAKQFAWDFSLPQRGTEKFYVETARSAARAGYEVEVHWDGELRGQDGVIWYIPRDIKPASGYVLWCNPMPGPYNPDTIRDALSVSLWTNFNVNPTQADQYLAHFRPYVDELVVISQFSAKQWAAAARKYEIPLRIVGHGVDPAVYHPPTDLGLQRSRNVVFSSSPDRGLAYLQRLWTDYGFEAQTGYRLVATNYGQSRPLTNHAVADLLRTSDFWIHPGIGVELFCISALEAQACGATPIVVPSGGLHESVKYGYRFPPSEFAEGLYSLLSGAAALRQIPNDQPTWDQVTHELLCG